MKAWRALVSILPLAVGCMSSGTVTRMVGGHRMEGRYVGDEAYAAYLRGVVLETRGQLDQAAIAYEDAIRQDPDSAELLTRIGALRCAARGKVGDPKAAWNAFSRAEKIDPTYEELWTERARCHLKGGDLEAARRAAEKAISLDPSRIDAVILLASILERQGKLEEARRWLDGVVVRAPLSVDGFEALEDFAARTHDVPRRESAERALALLRPRWRSDRPFSTDRPSLADIDGALLSGDFGGAQRRAIAAHLSSGALALRAAALGRVSFASREASLVLLADPSDTDARIAAAVAADLERDDDTLLRCLSNMPATSTPLSSLGTLLMGELLGRRVGAPAENAWRTAAGAIPATDDPLTAKVNARTSSH